MKDANKAAKKNGNNERVVVVSDSAQKAPAPVAVAVNSAFDSLITPVSVGFDELLVLVSAYYCRRDLTVGRSLLSLSHLTETFAYEGLAALSTTNYLADAGHKISFGVEAMAARSFLFGGSVMLTNKRVHSSSSDAPAADPLFVPRSSAFQGMLSFEDRGNGSGGQFWQNEDNGDDKFEGTNIDDSPLPR
ncbi:hypothetical protein HanRHA438_Chr11g0501681 [Helianthus annuus]|nr:hypothetical protein HanHA300_Chr11g0400591 [Helianthus annuus]KAJ0509215.1 hypothetical protein HanIR_Chr11g0526321 [Helianthus annuus]KAJ0517328.1 hypothetical protein HanHA89_Chr11g0424121 [Helianthus annuus]KAJ0685338.1 hypothetical protein HanLR1_Chr11g0401561 [Helianthus annuus]KAJ0689240.1 hypothetical protein HanOQP8_Chr11g0403491 [Helianthus annuus]